MYCARILKGLAGCLDNWNLQICCNCMGCQRNVCFKNQDLVEFFTARVGIWIWVLLFTFFPSRVKEKGTADVRRGNIEVVCL